MQNRVSKMKTYAGFLVLFYMGLVVALTDEQIAKIKELQKECVAETNIDPDVATKTMEGIFEEHPQLANYLFCMFKKAGYLNEAGEYQIDTMRSILTAKHNAHIADKIVGSCTTHTYATPMDTSLEFAKCYVANMN